MLLRATSALKFIAVLMLHFRVFTLARNAHSRVTGFNKKLHFSY